jgi:hypothetical protein
MSWLCAARTSSIDRFRDGFRIFGLFQISSFNDFGFSEGGCLNGSVERSG